MTTLAHRKPSYDGETLSYCTPDPYGYGRFLIVFSDGTGLLVVPNGSGSRWIEEQPELALWTGAGRIRWADLPGAARAEAHRRCIELDEATGRA